MKAKKKTAKKEIKGKVLMSFRLDQEAIDNCKAIAKREDRAFNQVASMAMKAYKGMVLPKSE